MLDVFNAVDGLDKDGLFHFRDNPNIDCPVGKNIHKATDDKLMKIQDSMNREMDNIKIGDVYDDIIKELDGESKR